MNQQNQHEHYYELEEQILIMFVYQQLLDTITKEMNEKKISYLLTSVNVCSSGLAVQEVDEAVKTSSNNGLSGSDDILE